MRVPPPLLFAVVVAVGFGLERLVTPLPLGGGEPWARVAANILAVVGAGILVAALAVILRSGQNPEPWKPTPSIVSSGIYRYSRNPMYLGIGLLQAAAGLRYGKGWLLVLVPASFAAVYWFAVRHEEAYLERKFGAEYLDYTKSVRRWL